MRPKADAVRKRTLTPFSFASMPTFVFVKNSESIFEFKGASPDKLRESIQKCVAAAPRGRRGRLTFAPGTSEFAVVG